MHQDRRRYRHRRRCRNKECLRQAGIEHAQLLAVAIPNDDVMLEVVAAARRIHPTIPIIARCVYTSAGFRAMREGAEQIVVAEQVVAQGVRETHQRPFHAAGAARLNVCDAGVSPALSVQNARVRRPRHIVELKDQTGHDPPVQLIAGTAIDWENISEPIRGCALPTGSRLNRTPTAPYSCSFPRLP